VRSRVFEYLFHTRNLFDENQLYSIPSGNFALHIVAFCFRIRLILPTIDVLQARKSALMYLSVFAALMFLLHLLFLFSSRPASIILIDPSHRQKLRICSLFRMVWRLVCDFDQTCR